MERSDRSSRRRRLRLAVVAGVVVPMAAGACRPPRPVAEFFGKDGAPHTPMCVVVAPALMPADEVDADVDALVREAAAVHGSIAVVIARGPSASAFTQVRFDDAANLGSFASGAGNGGARDADAARWRDAALAEIRNALADDANQPAGRPDGLDLFGGLDTCGRLLPGGTTPRTVALVTHGVHRTESLDLALDSSAAAAAVAEHLTTAAPDPVRVVLLGLGRVDDQTNAGPAARRVTEPVTAAWTAACAALAGRCSTRPTTQEANR